ncbi:LacI family DNA-binding transcriptional regulator [Marinimicrobium sp. ABcell2]|uniref:LacI family DNA-binding transcriptional regulator n=1 Tax=Marinimicrobium sp. ABcell2 TaxID=3069751 RepID=UPI0027AE7164|nr:LacI family DNA-binding transcriptional regulator [Marinimicrobium sp. ABcell2]MDQ2077330.1 LacI family DNA-binding transcriptional regulator [Marinimicrobium sp. ABcell2]
MGKATIDHVAERAGVSIKTVSRVVNNEPNVRPSTRDKVLRAVAELDYRPNLSARSLAGNRSYVIGLLYDNPSANYVIDVQDGVLAASRAQGYDLLIHPCNHRDPDVAEEVADLLRQPRVDGLILTPPLSDMAAVLEVLSASGTPFVRLAPTVDKHLSPYVETNDRNAAYQMTQQLLSLGHSRIGFISGHPDHRAVACRYEGYGDALRDQGLEVVEDLVEQGYNSFESGELAAQKLLALTPRPTAIFAANDDMAAGAMMVAHRMGLNVPAEVSVAGFDDTPVAHQIWPSLSTVRQPIQAMAKMAAELLLTQVQGKQVQAQSNLDSSLILRDSTGPAPK